MWFEVDYEHFKDELKRITNFRTGVVPRTDLCQWGRNLVYTDGAKVFFRPNEFLNVRVTRMTDEGISAVLNGDREQDVFLFCRDMVSEVEPVHSKSWLTGIELPIDYPWELICSDGTTRTIFNFEGRQCIRENGLKIIPIDEVEDALRVGYRRTLNQFCWS